MKSLADAKSPVGDVEEEEAKPDDESDSESEYLDVAWDAFKDGDLDAWKEAMGKAIRACVRKDDKGK